MGADVIVRSLCVAIFRFCERNSEIPHFSRNMRKMGNMSREMYILPKMPSLRPIQRSCRLISLPVTISSSSIASTFPTGSAACAASTVEIQPISRRSLYCSHGASVETPCGKKREGVATCAGSTSLVRPGAISSASQWTDPPGWPSPQGPLGNDHRLQAATTTACGPQVTPAWSTPFSVRQAASTATLATATTPNEPYAQALTCDRNCQIHVLKRKEEQPMRQEPAVPRPTLQARRSQPSQLAEARKCILLDPFAIVGEVCAELGVQAAR